MGRHYRGYWILPGRAGALREAEAAATASREVNNNNNNNNNGAGSLSVLSLKAISAHQATAELTTGK